MPDRIKFCEFCGTIHYEEEQDDQVYTCPEDGKELLDVKIVYTQTELDKAVQEERKALINMIETQITLPYYPKLLFLKAIRERGNNAN